jgi:hypothetical protein
MAAMWLHFLPLSKGFKILPLDGCKLKSNASKEWSGTLIELRWKQEKMEKKVRQLVEEQVKRDRGDDGDEPGRRSSGGAERGRQIGRLLKKTERVEGWLQENGPKMGGRAERLRVM